MYLKVGYVSISSNNNFSDFIIKLQLKLTLKKQNYHSTLAFCAPHDFYNNLYISQIMYSLYGGILIKFVFLKNC